MKFILLEDWSSDGGWPWRYVAVHYTLKEAIEEAYETLSELDENNTSTDNEKLINMIIFQASGELNMEDIKNAGAVMTKDE